jgi:lipoprotein signal peptidase
LDKWEELDVIYRAGQTKVSKMAGALVICLSAAAALLAIVKNTHARVKEATDLRLVALIGSAVRNFYDRTALNFIRTEYTNLNTNYWFNLRRRSIETCGHLLLIRD